MTKRLRRFAQGENGAANIEWTVVVALIVGFSLAVTIAVAQQAKTVNDSTVAKLASTVEP